jgi:prenylcysteine oxidase / farnesylcysteine lyase
MRLTTLGVICFKFLPRLVFADNLQIPLSGTDSPDLSTPKPHRIAIIGGGAAGTSAAYHLRTFLDASPRRHVLPDINITLFETESRVGGRTTTVNALNDTQYPTELGGSIFVEINQILYNATRDFGLDARSAGHSSAVTSDYDLGVWDGSRFVFTSSSDSSRWAGYWDIAKLLWKYGTAPIRTRNLQQSVIGKFLTFYDWPAFPFPSLQNAIEDAGLLEYVADSGYDMLKHHGVSDAFANDIVQASTRVNYAQNLAQIHSVETLVCMSTDGAMAIEGGNWQIFHELARRSGAEVKINSTIAQVTKKKGTDPDSAPTYHLTNTDGKHTGPYDAVVLAAPYQYADIDFSPPPLHVPQQIDYVLLHVTLFTSPHPLAPAFFHLPPTAQSAVPYTILTTLPASTSSQETTTPEFLSISNLQTIHPRYTSANISSPQNLYKIFSHAPLSAAFLTRLLDLPTHDSQPNPSSSIATLSSADISWYREKIWHSYPYEIPRTDFEHIRLEDEGLGKGVWYTSGIESFISTMETSALMGRNVAGLIVQDLEERFC